MSDNKDDERRMAVLEEMELRGDDSGWAAFIAGICFMVFGFLLVLAMCIRGWVMEIAKCPLCGKDVKKSIWRPEYEGCAGSVVITVKCCGMEAVGIELWNQYAAAMELAKTIVESENCKAEDEYKYQEFVEWARQYVLEVFK